MGKTKRDGIDVRQFCSEIISGNRRVLSKAITLIESELESDQELAIDLLDHCMPYTGNSYRIGITGIPGVGKSTLIDKWGIHLIKQGFRLAVLSIDPSSERSKGSILGDKTRMDQLSKNPYAFIRPSPNKGSLGGISRKTRECMLLCEAAGFDIIIVETVGVGQSENAVRNMVDLFILLLLPNAGDELQGIKKGIVEMADLIAVNKADGPYENLARHTQSNYKQALRLFSPPIPSWKTPVLLCSGINGTGIEELWEAALAFKKHLDDHEIWEVHRQAQMLSWVKEMINQYLQKSFYQHPAITKALNEIPELLLKKKQSPSQIARNLINIWKSTDHK